MLLRAYRPDDCKELAALFYYTVHTVNRADYSEEQVNAWADGTPDLDAWNNSFLSHCTMIAECGGTIAGFGDMDSTGYLDRLYVHAHCQRRGIASMICDALEQAVNTPVFTSHVSITARGFFEKRGYKVIRQQCVCRHSVHLVNYVMEKQNTACTAPDAPASPMPRGD